MLRASTRLATCTLWLLTAAAGQAHVVATVRVERIANCPAASPEERSQLFAARAEQTYLLVQRQLAPLLDDAPARVATLHVTERDNAARELARSNCGIDLQGLGVISPAHRTVVLAPSGKHRDDGTLWRASAHTTARLTFELVLPTRTQNQLGYGFLAAGLAHHATIAACGRTDCFVVHNVVMPPTLAWGGDLRAAAATLLAQGRLPPLRALLQTERDDFDLGQHVLALAVFDWLQDTGAAVTHGDGATPSSLAKLARLAQAGTPSITAIEQLRGEPLTNSEAHLHAFLRRRAPKVKARRAKPLPHHEPHPHAAVFVYTGQPVRARHRRIVAKALQQRHATHTSGWQQRDGKPLLQLGPVNRKAGFWHQNELVKTIPRTWPMVAVLEYDSRGAPTAYLDCLRRVTSQRGEDGWMLDPSVGFVPHHNAQIVTDHDDEYHYLAIPDTPTGSHVGGSEFVHRGRVRWQNGQFATVGISTLLHAPKSRTTASWHAIQTPLCDWRVVDANRKHGVRAVSAVADLDRDLAIWGTSRVFRFPAIPPGMTAGRGK